ncbi:MAG: hypothetical protein R3246_12420, partial [Acidimicrobiia bacterium]|nr:hypothetical protein [Acidimicrobiia bacterium]
MTATVDSPESDTEGRSRRLPSASQVLVGLGVLSAIGTLFLWLLGSLGPKHEPEVGRIVFGNIPTGLKVTFYVTTAVGLAVCFYLFSIRARNWQRGQSESRTGMWGARLRRLEQGL